MVDLLELKPTDKLLEIGTGTGSQTAVWQKFVKEVHSVELHPEYKVYEPLGGHVYLSYGDGAKGKPEAAPYDAIVATCGCPEIPPAWVDQLKEGGRLVAPVGTNAIQKLTLFRKKKGFLAPERIVAYLRFVMLEREADKWQAGI
jgi:protein-L-isoaspartate(D-aspartate) O-methyltransferase